MVRVRVRKNYESRKVGTILLGLGLMLGLGLGKIINPGKLVPKKGQGNPLQDNIMILKTESKKAISINSSQDYKIIPSINYETIKF